MDSAIFQSYIPLNKFEYNKSNSKCLIFTTKLNMSPRGGREMLSKLNYDVLNLILPDCFILYEVPPSKLRGFYKTIMAFFGYIDGLTPQVNLTVFDLIIRENIQLVFVDGSNLGGFVSALKDRMPRVEIILFCHNVETSFFWGAWKRDKSFHAFGVFIVNYLAERKAIMYSDKIIALSSRDSQLLKRIHSRSATHISPIGIEDKLQSNHTLIYSDFEVPFALFVGGNFYANRQGILWFLKNVVPLIDIKIVVIGNCMEAIRDQIDIPGCVEVVGSVDCLADWYRHAHFVIAPIFDGSGMKTKVAEALMYGKKIVGTPEAFSGYEDVSQSIGWICNNAEEFAVAIANARTTITTFFDPEMRKLYEKLYSPEAVQNRLSQVFHLTT
jgi:glycosyltransferase involved in cell wall biosynthesis